MKKVFGVCFILVALFGLSFTSVAQGTVVDLAMKSKDHTTLVKALKSAGLVSTLKGKGPFTVFGPDDAAFAKLPAGTTDVLMKPENKTKFQNLLKYHVVPGKIMSKDIAAAIKKGKGTATYATVEGEKLTFTMDGDKVKITDAQGGSAYVTAADMKADNGVIHSIDTVLMPK